MTSLNLSGQLHIRRMSRPEFDTLIAWASKEGWNPGLYDADIFWNTDPDGFIAAEMNGELIGGGSIVSYQGKFGFMGFFIVRPEYRGQGLGSTLWLARRKELESRLNAHCSIGMDGVFNMQPFYAKGGFSFSHRNIRFEGKGQTCQLDASVIPLSTVPFHALLDYDNTHFPAERADFLKAWISQPESRALAVMNGNQISGYGVIRRCKNGFKIGPLFADNAQIALNLFNGLSDHAANQAIFLDAPEINEDAMQLVKSKNMTEIFGCARMYFGGTPCLPNEKTYGVTSFELG